LSSYVYCVTHHLVFCLTTGLLQNDSST
jgi:nitrite reductase/ring-hydroxylating ferredoxin subunit